MVKNLPSNAGDIGLIPGWGTKIPHTMGQLSLCAETKDLECCSYDPMKQNKQTKFFRVNPGPMYNIVRIGCTWNSVSLGVFHGTLVLKESFIAIKSG